MVPAFGAETSPAQGWALARTADEARELAGFSTSVVTRDPERIWIAKERVVWEK